ncbi:MAG: metallophosphoesterase [Sterolibacteriaceae bacterium MAG5]|nr:metallophosphoesterase [Candidatus Nitricoxidireducens bremensis]
MDTTTNDAKVSILQISDVHFGCKDDTGEQERILGAIDTALEECNVPIDCVAFTGDLTQGAGYAEFQQGQEWLISVCEKVRAPCILVPGNHDVRRDKADTKILRSAYQDRESFGRWRDHLFKEHSHIRPFLDWFAQASEEFPIFLNRWQDNPAIDAVEATLAGVPCQFICLNSALLSCANDDDPKKGQKKLCVDIKGLNGALKNRIADKQLVIAVGHHPPDSLVGWNKDALTKALGQATGPHLYLHGHLHHLTHKSQYESDGSGYFRGAAGASYPGTEYPKQFSIITIELGEKQIASAVYAYHDRSGKWLPDATLSQPVPARLPTAVSINLKVIETAEGQAPSQDWTNPFSDVIANGIPPQYIHRLFVEPSNSLTKLRKV